MQHSLTGFPVGSSSQLETLVIACHLLRVTGYLLLLNVGNVPHAGTLCEETNVGPVPRSSPWGRIMEGVRLRAELGKRVQNRQGVTDVGVLVAHPWKLKLREGQKLLKAAQSGTAEPGAASGLVDSSLGSSCHSCFLFLDPEAKL